MQANQGIKQSWRPNTLTTMLWQPGAEECQLWGGPHVWANLSALKVPTFCINAFLDSIRHGGYGSITVVLLQ